MRKQKNKSSYEKRLDSIFDRDIFSYKDLYKEANDYIKNEKNIKKKAPSEDYKKNDFHISDKPNDIQENGENIDEIHIQKKSKNDKNNLKTSSYKSKNKEEKITTKTNKNNIKVLDMEKKNNIEHKIIEKKHHYENIINHKEGANREKVKTKLSHNNDVIVKSSIKKIEKATGEFLRCKNDGDFKSEKCDENKIFNLPLKISEFNIKESFKGKFSFEKPCIEICNVACNVKFENFQIILQNERECKNTGEKLANIFYEGVLSVKVNYLEPYKVSRKNIDTIEKSHILFLPIRGAENIVINKNFSNDNNYYIKNTITKLTHKDFKVYKKLKNESYINDYSKAYKNLEIIITSSIGIEIYKKSIVKL